ncbi:MAG: hypothetical protein IJ705_09510 [Oscillospiraceae bacterium]|nr:hypothetical protein [Oscillospiraceae bacterium]
MNMIPMDAENFRAVNTEIETVLLDGLKALRVVKNTKQDRFDEDTYARLPEFDFHNGTIEAEARSRLLPDAPDFARGFIGLVFRVDGRDAEFESYYVRPTNGRACADPQRRAHGSQYFSYPGYTFSYFREHAIEGFEAPCDIDLDEWIHLKAELTDAEGRFYVNDMEHPALVVPRMKHGPDARGAVGFYVDTGTEAFFRGLRVTKTD